MYSRGGETDKHATGREAIEISLFIYRKLTSVAFSVLDDSLPPDKAFLVR